MKILYVASDIDLAGSHGGAVHVRAVARELARRGHELCVAARRGFRAHEFAVRGVLPRAPRWCRLLAFRAVLAETERLRPDVIVERYYNFGGEGLLAAARYGIPVVLEVNSPMVEYPGSPKQLLDACVGFPLRRWREWMATRAAAIVTPTAAILPPRVPPERVHQLSWGADTERFRPDGPVADLPGARGRAVVSFVSSFRAWHGAELLVEAATRLRATGRTPLFLMIGDGPMRAKVERTVCARGLRRDFLFLGAVEHEALPPLLRRAQIGAAPFETRRHPYLAIDFYWRPLKIFEYMAMGLAVVTPDLPALREIVRPNVDGLLYPEGDADALAQVLQRLVEAPDEAARMGRAACERARERFSWRGHVEALERILDAVASGRADWGRA